MLIQSTKNFSDGRQKLFVYGESGVGKTTLASTLNEPTLFVSMEGGVAAIDDYDIPLVDCTVDDNKNLLSIPKRLEKFNSVYEYILQPEQRQKFKWIFIDSLSEIAQNLIEFHKFTMQRKGFDLWGEVGSDLRQIVKKWRDVPYYNVVFVALSEQEKDGEDVRFHHVGLPGKFSQQVFGYFDQVLFFYKWKDENGKLQRKLFTSTGEKFVAKDRSGKLDPMMEPNLHEVSKRIRGGRETPAPRVLEKTRAPEVTV